MKAAETLSDGLEKLEQIVRPIKWGKTSYGTPEAQTVTGVYRIVHAMNGGYTVTAKGVVLRTDDGRENFATVQDAIDAAEADYLARIASALNLDPLLSEIKRMREAAQRIHPYLRFTIGSESPGHHPTMPSAVAAFEAAFALSTLSLQEPDNGTSA